MLIFLYGQDTYRSREALRRIIGEQEKASLNWFNFVRIDAKEKEVEMFEQIHQNINMVSMFSEKKLIVIENIFSASLDSQSNLLKIIKEGNLSQNNETTIVFWSEESDSKNKLFEFLNKSADCQKFEPLQGTRLKNWVRNYIFQNNGSATTQAIDRLIADVGNDLWHMSNEINKLLSFNRKIEVNNIEKLVNPEIDLNIFEIIDALGFKNKKKALRLVEVYFEKGEDEMRLLGMFIYQFRNLIRFKSAPAEKLNMHPFVLSKTREEAKNFSFAELKKIYYQLLTIDFEIKSGKNNALNALELFIAGI